MVAPLWGKQRALLLYFIYLRGTKVGQHIDLNPAAPSWLVNLYLLPLSKNTLPEWWIIEKPLIEKIRGVKH